MRNLARKMVSQDPNSSGGLSPGSQGRVWPTPVMPSVHVHSPKKPKPQHILEPHFGSCCRDCANTFGKGFGDQAVLWVESQKQNVLVLLPSWCLRTWLPLPRNGLPADVILPLEGKHLWVQQFRTRSEGRWGNSKGNTPKLASVGSA